MDQKIFVCDRCSRGRCKVGSKELTWPDCLMSDIKCILKAVECHASVEIMKGTKYSVETCSRHGNAKNVRFDR